MGRRKSRETTMKLLYQIEINKLDWQEQVDRALEEDDCKTADKIFIKENIQGVKENIVEIDKKINGFLKGWKTDRIPKIDLAILRLSIYEIVFRNDIPYTVSVNEAVDLAKKYSTSESGSFINGVLSRLAKK